MERSRLKGRYLSISIGHSQTKLKWQNGRMGTILTKLASPMDSVPSAAGPLLKLIGSRPLTICNAPEVSSKKSTMSHCQICCAAERWSHEMYSITEQSNVCRLVQRAWYACPHTYFTLPIPTSFEQFNTFSNPSRTQCLFTTFWLDDAFIARLSRHSKQETVYTTPRPIDLERQQ